MDGETDVKQDTISQESKKPTAKKPLGKAPTEVKGRQRARTINTNTFEPGNKQTIEKGEAKPIETIGESKFKNLLGMFDKGKSDNSGTSGISPPKGGFPIGRNSNADRIAMFSGGNKLETNESKPLYSGGVSDSIKKRMDDMLNQGKEKDRSKSATFNDPILLNMKKDIDHEGVVEENQKEEDDLSDPADDLDISADENKEDDKKDDLDGQEKKEGEVKKEDEEKIEDGEIIKDEVIKEDEVKIVSKEENDKDLKETENNDDLV